jgi:hypothetical protein
LVTQVQLEQLVQQGHKVPKVLLVLLVARKVQLDRKEQ